MKKWKVRVAFFSLLFVRKFWRSLISNLALFTIVMIGVILAYWNTGHGFLWWACTWLLWPTVYAILDSVWHALKGVRSTCKLKNQYPSFALNKVDVGKREVSMSIRQEDLQQ